MRVSHTCCGHDGTRNSGHNARISSCRRAKTLSVVLPARRTREPVHVVIDSTGLKVFGEGEWKVREHGWSKRRSWRTLHLAIDERTDKILAELTTTADVADCECLPALLDSIDEPLGQVSADGAYDTVACHQAIERRQARAAIPPRVNAVVNDTGWWNAREDAVREVLKYGLLDWKRTSGEHRRSLAETMMFRMKAVFGDQLAARTLERQHTETRIRCLALNRMTALGMPHSERVATA